MKLFNIYSGSQIQNQIPFQTVVSLTKHYWAILGERRGTQTARLFQTD
jgi:hypothetical protein